MIQFYVSILFLGIILIVSAFIWILADRRKTGEDVKRLEEKKNELVQVIEDSEQMLEELNKFSDYIVTRVNEKNEELNSTLQTIESKLAQSNIHETDINQKNLEKEETLHEIDSQTEDIQKPQIYTDYSQAHAVKTRTREKVIPINSKHREVLNLASKGLQDEEIAKTLNIGRGEIRMILGLNSSRAKAVNK